MDDKQDQKVRPYIAGGVLFTVAALGVSLAQYLYTIGSGLSDRVQRNTTCCASFESYRAEDSYQRQYWVNVIDDNRRHIEQLESRLSILATQVESLLKDPGKRPDPFTGQDGREMRDMLRREIKESVDSLRNDMRQK